MLHVTQGALGHPLESSPVFWGGYQARRNGNPYPYTEPVSTRGRSPESTVRRLHSVRGRQLDLHCKNGKNGVTYMVGGWWYMDRGSLEIH